MRRKGWSCLLSGMLTLSILCGAAVSAQDMTAAPASEAAGEEEEQDSFLENLEESEYLTDVSVIDYEKMIQALGLENTSLGEISNEDIQKAADFVRDMAKVMDSPEFQELVDYSEKHIEVRELINALMDKAAELVRTEPELVRKVLITLGVNPGILDLAENIGEKVEEVKALCAAALATKEGQLVMDFLGKLLNDSEIAIELMADTISTVFSKI